MGKEDLNKLTDDQLLKRKKFSSTLLVILIVVAALDITMLIYDLTTGDGFNTSLFVPAVACLIIALPIYLGKKKINEELQKRDLNKKS